MARIEITMSPDLRSRMTAAARAAELSLAAWIRQAILEKLGRDHA